MDLIKDNPILWLVPIIFVISLCILFFSKEDNDGSGG